MKVELPEFDFLFRERFERLKTREVFVGDVGIGGNNPIRLQSMTSVDTMNTSLVVQQIQRMVNAGSELVRLTAQGVREAEHLAVIKARLNEVGYNVPLIADIHYSPAAAEAAARVVEKVRINPGNYTDRNTGKSIYSDTEYDGAVDRIREKMAPLISICKDHGTAIRIGSNHGSLSERIVSRYGDTPMGMAYAALEFIQVCESLGYYNMVVSMKASNTRIMVQATRIMVALMHKYGSVYPLHLGVTEAGEGEDGRIRSAVGIGTLLADGIGDTIRVSLTEEPENELPVARTLRDLFASPDMEELFYRPAKLPINPAEYNRRETHSVCGIGGVNPGVVLTLSNSDFPMNPEGKLVGKEGTIVSDFMGLPKSEGDTIALLRDVDSIKLPVKGKGELILLAQPFSMAVNSTRSAIFRLIERGDTQPVILCYNDNEPDEEIYAVKAAAHLGPLFIDGLADGLDLLHPSLSDEVLCRIAYGILQATRSRITATEYVSCPSCGRTKYNIQQAVKEIRSKTSHLAGLTIGIMGCIVNGPGEMADADYGYVGSGNGVITLFRGKHPVRKNIPEENAVQELITLIQEDGRWIEP